jgi:hypothetical protein
MEMTLRESEDIATLVARLMARKTLAIRTIARSMGLDLPPATEAERLDAIRAAALPPESCGPDMPSAPARGPLRVIHPLSMVRTEDGYDLRHTGWRGRDAARARDIFDEMADQARRAGGFDPFTLRQKDTARAYATLVERHSSRGLKGRSIETMSGGRGGRGGDGVMDRILLEGERIAGMRAAVGDGLALEVRRAGARVRASIRLRDLVDLVCIEGRSISDVLARFGWTRDGKTRAEAQAALAGALDRMATHI